MISRQLSEIDPVEEHEPQRLRVSRMEIRPRVPPRRSQYASARRQNSSRAWRRSQSSTRRGRNCGSPPTRSWGSGSLLWSTARRRSEVWTIRCESPRTGIRAPARKGRSAGASASCRLIQPDRVRAKESPSGIWRLLGTVSNIAGERGSTFIMRRLARLFTLSFTGIVSPAISMAGHSG